MKFKKYLKVLVAIIIVLSAVSSLIGMFSHNGNGQHVITSINGEKVILYGRGIYKNDSISVVAQGKAQDLVTIVLGIPMLIISMSVLRKDNLRGKLLLTGTLGYFLYTYMSYTFLWNFNYLFLVYVTIMSCSLFAFIMSIMEIDIHNIKNNFKDKLPNKLIGGFEIFIGIAIGMMWLGKIAQALKTGSAPNGLEHYTTLVIQGMDLGFVVPFAILSGILLIRENNYGYLMSSIIIIKGFSMFTTITVMMISMMLSGVAVSLIEIIIFSIANLVCVYLFIILLKSINVNRN
ncbi:hypothetical protein [Clostridium hydrogenum]|uniref:hypothetical protein n=1 Tax=Clostridium hydrogenum TaxID=2855764 RepID=UPI001F472E56|nr:hypothetical protein [Clostridium hydrogenum]